MAEINCMPVLENVQVSLTEILEVRGCSLEEWELWGILFQTTEAVQDIFLKGQACKDSIPQHLVTPDTLLCTSMGRIILHTCFPENIHGSNYWCHEMTDKDSYFTTSKLEKIYVYTIGQTIQHAAFYKTQEGHQKKFSPLFKTVLQAICQKDIELRMVLSDITEVCCCHGYKHMNGFSFLKSVISLHREVLNSLPEKEILTQVDQDVMRENEEEETKFEGEDVEEMNYDTKYFSYGHRLGYHPELNASNCKIKKFSKITPKERWKKAYNKVIEQIYKSKSNRQDKEKIMNEWRKHKAHQTIFRVYEELTERRKMLELLRLSINIGPSAPVDVDKNPLLMTGLKPKTMAELVLLLQRPAKQPAIINTSLPEDGSCSGNLNISPDSSLFLEDSDHDKPYYALHKIVSKIPLKVSDINALSGPEFMIGRLKPHMRISLFPDDFLEYQNSILNLSIVLLTGECIEVECLPSTSGKQLFQAVADHIKLHERYLFGISCEIGGEYLFLERKQKLADFLQFASPSISSVYQLYFRVKFYLDDLHLMRTQSLQHLFYLQLRKNFLNDDFCPDSKLAINLGSLALQAEFGDYDNLSHGKEYFLVDHYFPFQCAKQMNHNDVKTKLQKLHANLKGISKQLAESKFILNMMQTTEYGCHFHKVYQEKKNLSSAVWLGIKPKGIEVYEIVSGKRSISQKYPWQNILRISFSKKCFCLAPRTESITGKHIVYRFYTSLLHRSLYLFNITMAHHKYFLKLKSVTKASEIFFEEKEVGCDLYDFESKLQLKNRKTKSRCSITKSSNLKNTNFTDLKNLQMFKNLLPCLEDIIILSSKGSGRIKKKKKYSNVIMRSSSDPVRKDYSLCPNRNLSLKELNSCTTRTLQNDFHTKYLKLVRLHKDGKYGLGMVITCGDTYDTLLHGSFVESVYSGSPADIDGGIKPGDRIMSVNGKNVQNDYFLTVVDLIQCSNSPVEIVVSKANKASQSPASYPKKEVIEKPCTKAKTWIVGDEKSDLPKIIDGISNHSPISEMPIPKPRRKLTQKKSNDQPPLDVPDLTLNHTKVNSSHESCSYKPDTQIINDHCKNWSIPDIIPSQINCTNSSETSYSSKCDEYNGTGTLSSLTGIDENELLPGEVYHVVLDKKGGSLGLNIFHGSEIASTVQKHIYIHSVIPNGAAALDGRIQPGDKLLEVNSIPLEDLSYQEVVTTLRESPQVAHLVLERGYSHQFEIDESPNTPRPSQDRKGFIAPKETDKNSTPTEHLVFNFENTSKSSSNVYSLDTTEKTFEHGLSDDENAFSSLPISVESSVCGAKGTISAPSSYQHLDHVKANGKISHPSADCLDCDLDKVTSFTSSPIYTKDEQRFLNGLSSYKSTPNLVDSSDEDDDRHRKGLYRNPSSDCLLHSPHFLNPHQALIDLYNNYAYVRGSASNIHQIPAIPIRKRKLKRLEDIYKYCNIENTFIVSIRKSSRGLGLAISGGKDASRKDHFSQLIQIKKLYPLQPALECGKLQLGDVILEVNGTSMIGLTNTEALEFLRSAPVDVVLKVFRPSKSLIPSFSIFKGGIWPGFNSSSSSASSSLSRTENNSYNVETGEFEITLIKKDGTLGFTIARKETSSDGPEGIYVKALVREHAVSDGRIQPGDRILQVNGIDVSNLSHMDALNCLRNTSDKVTLKLYRDDPPLTPNGLDEDYIITKPLRWEAFELLNDRVKQKGINDENNTLKRRIKRKLDKCSNAPSNTSSESTSSNSSSGQEHIIEENENYTSALTDELNEFQNEQINHEDSLLSPYAVGLQRNQRPKSLDVLNSSDHKRFGSRPEEDCLHRQASVMCSNADSKCKIESNENGCNNIKAVTNLRKWRGSTLPDSEESSYVDTIQENAVLSSKDLILENHVTENTEILNTEEDDYKPVPYPRTTSYKSEWVNTFDVSLDRGWHLRLGFSVCDPLIAAPDLSREALPTAAEVKAVYPGSLADKDGRIKVGDRIVEVNGESLLGKSAREVIDILRKTRGLIRMVFCRLEKCS